jgi:hypothetical protein
MDALLNRNEMGEKDYRAAVTVNRARIDQARTRSELAKTRREEVKTRAELAKTCEGKNKIRTEQVEKTL